MLPTGHIAAGYIVARTFISLVHPALSAVEQQHLLGWGMFFAFAPDLDTFAVFIKMKRFISSDDVSHRKFWSHAPILWLLAGLVVSFFGWAIGDTYIQYFGLILWLCSWSHFALDSIQHGVMWLWPWRKRPLAFLDPEIRSNIPPQDFIPYWVKSVKFYMTRMSLSFTLELVVIIGALLSFYR
jgi:hypothetical protein